MNDVQGKSERGSSKLATRERQQALRGQLLDAAEAVIAGHGLASLRARALADAVGCSVGAIYGAFADLDALILAVNGRTLEAVDRAMRRAGGRGEPEERLVRLAEAYLAYASAHRHRWAALFLHRMPPGRVMDEDFTARQVAAFSHIEAPLADLRPDIGGAELQLLARTMFAAVHGMVELGLDEKLAPASAPFLREQISIVVSALGRGLRKKKKQKNFASAVAR